MSPAKTLSLKEQKSFSALLSQLRQEKGLTQAEVAEAAGVSAGLVSKIEGGEYKTPAYHVLPLLRGLATTPEDLGRMAEFILNSPTFKDEQEFWRRLEGTGDRSVFYDETYPILRGIEHE